MESKARIEAWARQVTDAQLCTELATLRENGQEEELHDRFYCDLSFGTGGLRGKLGVGTNRMNLYIIRQATAGLLRYLISSGLPLRAAIAYDSRHLSDAFAREAARTLAAGGVEVFLYPRLTPTPTLSFAVRKLGCGAGICITASHNPAAYNGYKVYGSDGCQITTEAATAIQKEIREVDPFAVELSPEDAPLIQRTEEAVLNAYLEEVLSQRVEMTAPAPLKIVFTPLHGAGMEMVTRALARAGYQDVTVVEAQRQPDGNFPTCPYPNPEEPAALSLGLELCRETKADLLLGTDPDCDRVGIAVRNADDYTLLSGNEVGVLLLNYLCRRRMEAGTLPERPVAIRTIVTSTLADKIAEKYGVEIIETLTGFKFIGEQIGWLEQAGQADRFLFGFEESYGYLAGSYVRDKDAVVASLLISDMAAWYKKQGKTLLDAIESIYKEFGYTLCALHSFTFEGEAGRQFMDKTTRALRENPPQTLCGRGVRQVTDYLWAPGQQSGPLPSSDVLQFLLDDRTRLTIRPSGTEPKLKIYLQVEAPSRLDAEQRLEDIGRQLNAWLGRSKE